MSQISIVKFHGNQSKHSRRWHTQRRYGLRDDIGAVNKLADILPDDSKFGHSRLEVGHHKLLVVYHALPLASGAL